MYIDIREIICYKAEFDENTKPIYLLFKSKIMYDLNPCYLDFKIYIKDIKFELKGDPVKLIISECNKLHIDVVDSNDRSKINKQLMNYILNNELKCSWFIFAISHLLYKKETKPDLKLVTIN